MSSPLINEDLPGSWPGRYIRIDSPKQHSLYGTTDCLIPYFRHQACYGLLHGMLGQKSVYVRQCLTNDHIKSVQSVQNLVDIVD